MHRNVLNHQRLNAFFRSAVLGAEDLRGDQGPRSGRWPFLAAVRFLAEPNTAEALPLRRTTAHLLLKKALAAVSAAAAAAEYRDEALRILRAHMADQGNVSLHVLHIFGSQVLDCIWRWTHTVERAEQFREIHEELKRAIPDHLRNHAELVRVLEDLKRAELETTVHS